MKPEEEASPVGSLQPPFNLFQGVVSPRLRCLCCETVSSALLLRRHFTAWAYGDVRSLWACLETKLLSECLWKRLCLEANKLNTALCPPRHEHLTKHKPARDSIVPWFSRQTTPAKPRTLHINHFLKCYFTLELFPRISGQRCLEVSTPKIFLLIDDFIWMGVKIDCQIHLSGPSVSDFAFVWM